VPRGFRFVFQPRRVPFTIKLAAALIVVFQVTTLQSNPALAATIFRSLSTDPLAIAATLLWIVMVAWAVVATLRLSRLPVILATALLVAAIVWVIRFHFGDGVDAFVGLAAAMGTWVLLTALVVPHWRRLNWRFLGRLDPVQHVEEHFT